MDLNYKQYKKLQRCTRIVAYLKIALIIVFVAMTILQVCAEK
jgi:predicted nucleic acid-binding Zn ribbon protein